MFYRILRHFPTKNQPETESQNSFNEKNDIPCKIIKEKFKFFVNGHDNKNPCYPLYSK